MNLIYRVRYFLWCALTVWSCIGLATDRDAQTKNRNLYLDTAIVANGKPALTIVAPASGELDQQAGEIVSAVQKKTGVKLAVVRDSSQVKEQLLKGNLLLLGNRSNNKYISELYDLYYCVQDICYPGLGGSAVRTLHNPLGNGHNVIFAGGSDLEGTANAVKTLVGKINALKFTDSQLKIGWLMDIKLGKGLKVPENAEKACLLEASREYGNFGYFGWNSLSKNMALYYLTGEERFAREFLRLAFPDKAALKYLNEVDKEMAEVKEDPIGGPYHYGAMMMIIYWDMIEESPVFSAAEREKVNKAFFRQMEYLKKGHFKIFSCDKSAGRVGDRHAQWEALSVFALCRYMDKHYPDSDSAAGLNGVKNFFASLDAGIAEVMGESGSMNWRSTSLEPVFNYVLLVGNRQPLNNGVLKKLAESMMVLVNGRSDDWALGYAATESMLKVAYLLDDQSFYRIAQQTGFRPDRLMIGQSFCPDKPYRNDIMAEQAGKWTFEPAFTSQYKKKTAGELFACGSYRSVPGPGGDYVLLEGVYGGGRSIYRCLTYTELRLAGVPLLVGHHNQIYVYKDEMYGKKAPQYTELLNSGTVGDAVFFQGVIPDYNGYCLDRTLLLRRNKYAIFADDVTAVNPGNTASIEVLWEFVRKLNPVLLDNKDIEVTAATASNSPAKFRLSCGGKFTTELLKMQGDSAYHSSGDCPRMSFSGKIAKGETQTLFSILAPTGAGIGNKSICAPYGAGGVALLPEPALLAKESNGGITVSTEKYFTGLKFTGAGNLGKTEYPVNIDWDFATGNLTLECDRDTKAEFNVSDSGKISSPDVKAMQRNGNTIKIELKNGISKLTGALPLPAFIDGVKEELTIALPLLAAAKSKEEKKESSKLSEMSLRWKTGGNGKIVSEICSFPASDAFCAAAAGDTLMMIDKDGKTKDVKLNGDIGAIHWWPSKKLLLTGGKDDKVTAWGVDRQKKWEFTSLMAPEVYKTGKFYWYKEPRYHAGVYSIYTGTFLNNQEQAFIGGACTVEVLDGNGKLIARIPEYWGPVSMFTLIPQPDGSTSLAAGMSFCGIAQFGLLNNRKLDKDAVEYSFYKLPDDCDRIGGWLVLNNTAVFCEDMDGDGKNEVVATINGAWNRIVIWDVAGKPLAMASLGPGEKSQHAYPSRKAFKVTNIKDVEVTDLYGKGRKQIIAALSRNMILCCDHKCKTLWVLKTETEPQAIAVVPASASSTGYVFVATLNGDIFKIDAGGKVVARSNVGARATTIKVIGDSVLAGTEKGTVYAFKL